MLVTKLLKCDYHPNLFKRSSIIRNRIIYGIAIVVTMLVGLFSRSGLVPMPRFVVLYVGDGIWALLVFWLACFFKPAWPLKYRVAAALAFAYAIEFSQLYQADWINQIRQTRLGGLVLGFSFLPSDLVAYTIGIASGEGLDCLARKKWDADER